MKVRLSVVVGAIFWAVVLSIFTAAFASDAHGQTVKTYTNTDLKPTPRSAEDERVLAARAKAEAERKAAAAVEVIVTGPESIIETERKAAERANPGLALVRISRERCARLYRDDLHARETCEVAQGEAIIEIIERTKKVNRFTREVCRRFAGDNFVVMNACERKKS